MVTLLIFIPAFILFWLVISSLLSALSGWFTLASRYPDRPERPISRISGESGSMGGVIPVSFGGALTISACQSGVRVAMNRVLGPFSRPFFVPWNHIRAEPRQTVFWRQTRLRFGEPEIGRLSIRLVDWERMLQARSGSLLDEGGNRQADNRIMARRMFTGWAIMALLFGVVSLLAGAVSPERNDDLSPLVSAAFPGAFFGVLFLVGYLIKRRWR